MEKIEEKDVYNIILAKNKVEIALVEAEKFALAAKLADVQYKNIVNNIFMKYGLSKGDTIDDKTGEITREKKDVENRSENGSEKKDVENGSEGNG